MAAFPPPHLQLSPSPLLNFFILLHSFSGTLDARQQFADKLAVTPVSEASAALHEFDRMLDTIRNHRGSVGWHEDLRWRWQTPYDCLKHFDWIRETILSYLPTMDDPPIYNPAWMTETVVALRDAILAERAFDRLPILADALEEAGCDNRVILDHLRADDDHSHMCWVLDVLNAGWLESTLQRDPSNASR